LSSDFACSGKRFGGFRGDQPRISRGAITHSSLSSRARYDELDFEKAVWRIPAGKMSEPAGSLHREKIATDQREYCAKDAEGMIGLLRHLIGRADE